MLNQEVQFSINLMLKYEKVKKNHFKKVVKVKKIN
jgi:hypothetical protein